MSLDDDLAAWAASVRLSGSEAAAIFQRIVSVPTAPAAAAPPPGLDPSWWRHFTADFAARMVASNAPARFAA